MVFLLLLYLFIGPPVFSKTIKNVTLKSGEVLDVHTALGFSTLLQFSSKPTSVIVGDQDAFKVEYVGTSLSIKPVLPSAKTNLFVFVDYEKYNIRLLAGPSKDADYLIKFNTANETRATLHGQEVISPVQVRLKKRIERDGIQLIISSLEWPPSRSAAVIRFSLLSKRDFQLSRSDFSVIAGGKELPISDLFLESATVKANTEDRGTLVLRNVNKLSAVTLCLSVRQKTGNTLLTIDIPLGKKKNGGAN